jgi:PEGA domain
VYPEEYLSMPTSQIRATKKTALLISAWCVLLGSAFASSAYGQAVAETAGGTSVGAAATTSMRPVMVTKLPNVAGTASGSAHLVASYGPAPEDTNRKVLEEKAGKDASKLLLRATPVEAQIWVNGKIVGKTPLLLVLAPGKYQVEMRGARGQTGRRSVDLLPHETRELAVKLEQLYPGRITVTR